MKTPMKISLKTMLTLPSLALPVVYSGLLALGSGAATSLPAREAAAQPALATRDKEGGIGIGAFAQAGAAGDEIITIILLDKDGKRVEVVAKTGKFGSSNKLDDIKKKLSGPLKAELIAKSINRDAAGLVIVRRAGHVLTLQAKAPYRGVVRVRVSNNTRQHRNKVKVSYPMFVQPRAELVVAPDVELARVIMIGGIEGLDDDGAPSVLQLGTERWVGNWLPQRYGSLERLIRKVCKDLQVHGIQAMLENPFSIRIDLDPSLDGGLVYGNTDLGIQQMAASGGS